MAAGSVVALVGPSGSGKSTALKLVCGFERPDAGEAAYGGAPRGGVGLRDVRSQVTVVWPDAGLFHGTLRENLTLGAAKTTDEQVERAVEICRWRRSCRRLGGGFDAPVAEGGASLSGGKRQRVALARAFLRRTPILILDEATSNLDVETALVVLEALAVERRRLELERVGPALETLHREAERLVVCAPAEGVVLTDGLDRLAGSYVEAGARVLERLVVRIIPDSPGLRGGGRARAGTGRSGRLAGDARCGRGGPLRCLGVHLRAAKRRGRCNASLCKLDGVDVGKLPFEPVRRIPKIDGALQVEPEFR